MRWILVEATMRLVRKDVTLANFYQRLAASTARGLR